jgi:putative transcription factor
VLKYLLLVLAETFFAMKINEKESIIRRVELQQMVPDENLKRKIEEFLDIELTEVYKQKKFQPKPAKGTLTLGDIIEIK